MMRTARHWFTAALLSLCAAIGGPVGDVHAQGAYPTRPIDLISGFAAGGTTDLVARMVAKRLGDKWGFPINVVNKPGGSTVPAQLEVYNAKPDGHMLYADNIGSSSMLHLSVQNLPFKVMDRTFVTMISSNSMLIFVAPNSPLKTLKDVADEARRDPERFTWTGVGVAEIPMRQLLDAAGVDIGKTKSVVSTGSVAGAVLAAGSNVKVGIAAVGPSLGPAGSGLIRPIAITAEERWVSLPDVPTAKQAGYPNVKVVSWIGISGPPNLPDHIVVKWNEGVREMLADPTVLAQLTNMASIADYRDSKAFKDDVAREITEFNRLWGTK